MRAHPSTWVGPALVGLASVAAAAFFLVSDLRAWHVVLEDDFDQPSRGTLAVNEDRGRRLQYVAGEYEILISEKDSWWSSTVYGESSDSSMRVAVDARLLRGSRSHDYYGVGCGRGRDTAYVFAVSQDGDYLIARVPEGDGQWATLASGQTAGVVEASQSNRIEAECVGRSGEPTQLRLGVNGRAIARARGGGIDSFDSAWLISSASTAKSIARFDDLVVSKK